MASSARIDVTPDVALLPTPISIRASGFTRGARVRISSHLTDEVGIAWSAHGEFVADAAGAIDVADAPSEAGTYSGTDAAGLLWSMQPPSGLDRRFQIEARHVMHTAGRPAVDPLQPLRIRFVAECVGGPRAEASLTLRRLLDGIDVLPVRDGRLRGLVFRHRDRTRARGAIMSLTGSGGGVETSYAPVLASLGYDVLSLAYFAYEDLPRTIASLPLEYFAEGFEWMRRELGAKRTAVQGASRGGELTVALASYLPQYVDGAIGIVPMYASSAGWDPDGKGVGGPSWTFEGREIPWAEPQDPLSLDDMRRLAENLPLGYAATPYYRADLDRPEVRAQCAFPIERTHGRLLLISAMDDQMWPCSWGSDVVVNRLRAKGHRHAFSHLALPDTGHWTPLPNTVTSFTQATYHSLGKVMLACGGTPQGTARSSRTLWDGMVAHYDAVFR
jgi:acyl-coenzyme A thioesterase 1/2/4